MCLLVDMAGSISDPGVCALLNWMSWISVAALKSAASVAIALLSSSMLDSCTRMLADSLTLAGSVSSLKPAGCAHMTAPWVSRGCWMYSRSSRVHLWFHDANATLGNVTAFASTILSRCLHVTTGAELLHQDRNRTVRMQPPPCTGQAPTSRCQQPVSLP